MDHFEFVYSRFGSFIYEILPLSPFQPYIAQFASFPYLGYLNWFFPISAAVKVMGVWLTVITTFLVYQWILRCLKVVS